MKMIFKDLKVIEFASVLAGPAVGMFLAELGAEVIKIENKDTDGDVTRKWKLPLEQKERNISAYFCSVNWGKKHLFMDLKDENDKQKIYGLVKEADIVISNFKLGDDLKLGMDYNSIKKIKNDIIYGTITGFNSGDKRSAFDVVLQAETGYMAMTGTHASGSLKMPIAMIDILAAHQMKEAILVAIIRKMKTGEGAHLSVSLYDTAVASLANQATNWLMCGHIPQKMGSLHPNIAPYGEIMITKDSREIVLAVGSDAQFKKLCEVIGDGSIGTRPEYATNQLRVENRERLCHTLRHHFLQYDRDEIMENLNSANVPAGAIKNLFDVFSDQKAMDLVLSEVVEGYNTKRTRQVVFKDLNH